MKQIIKLTESQLLRIIKNVINENRSSGVNIGNPPKSKLACVGPNDYNQIGEARKAIVYKMRDGEYQLDNEGIARMWDNNKLKQLRRGEWQCTNDNTGIEVKWEDKPNDIQYFGLPKNSFAKSIGQKLDTSKCAKEQTDIFNGKFLLKGCSGPFVEDIQNRFKKLGYNLAVDGIFGDGTKQVIMQYQKEKNIKVDGVFGRSTLDYLVGDEIGKSPKQTTSKLNPQQKLVTQNYPKDK